jgi:hypothetical protein
VPPTVTLPIRKQATLARAATLEGAGGEPGAARTMAVRRDADAVGADRWAPRLALLLWALTLSGLAAVFWLDHLLRRAGRPELTIRAHELTYVAAVAGMATVGAVLAGRRPRHPVGWLMLALGLSVTVDGVTDGYARYGLLASPGAVPAVGQVRVLGDTFALWPACIGFILLLTPTGSLPSPRWRWWARIAVVAPLLWMAATVLGIETAGFQPFYSFRNPYFVPALAAPAMAVALPALAITLLSVVVGGASLVVRFRRARGEERQQLRWVASAAVVAAAGIPVAMAGIAIESATVVGVAVLGLAAVLCLAIAAAILRYRLYDLDRVISRTLAYGLLTLSLGSGYAAVVLGARPAPRPEVQPGRCRRHPGRGRRLPAGPPPHPSPRRPPLQPAPPRRRPDHRRLRHPPA